MASVSWRNPDINTEAVLQAGAEHLLEEANRKAPIETGDLIRSGVARASGDEAAVGYNTPYAARQHEELGYQHDAGREAKWLENALNNHGDAILETIAATVRRQLG
ncbi:hypothetical protein AXK57_19720 [Tsukamurella pulmonis]|uniref:HK97 gp10 family phage protein n=1 Tax=Tsukamurella pulmonis TaxID=47312 RepID=UPI00079A9DCE|nr:HK97 gp10 family phage protein [Tsukamurella pulmonis]KXP12180.1 hypothetical protein AXK57_19720 [Tsukamurella pulmonis]